MKSVIFPVILFVLILVLFFTPEISQFISKMQVTNLPTIEEVRTFSSRNKDFDVSRASIKKQDLALEDTHSKLLESVFSKQSSLDIVSSPEFKAALKMTRSQISEILKKLPKENLSLEAYLKGYDHLLSKVLSFKTLNPQIASKLLEEINKYDLTVSQLLLTSGVDANISREWFKLSLAPWISSSVSLRESLKSSTVFAPAVRLESVKVKLPPAKSIKAAYEAGSKLFPSVDLSFSAEGSDIERYEFYVRGVLLDKGKLRSKSETKKIKIRYKAPLGRSCLVLYNSAGESNLRCYDLLNSLNYYSPENHSLNLTNFVVHPKSKSLLTLDRAFAVSSTTSRVISGLQTF